MCRREKGRMQTYLNISTHLGHTRATSVLRPSFSYHDHLSTTIYGLRLEGGSARVALDGRPREADGMRVDGGPVQRVQTRCLHSRIGREVADEYIAMEQSIGALYASRRRHTWVQCILYPSYKAELSRPAGRCPSDRRSRQQACAGRVVYFMFLGYSVRCAEREVFPIRIQHYGP